MSRYCGPVATAPILEAAARWKERAFLEDGSVFSEQGLWTVEMLQALDTHFVKNPDEGSGSFLVKLEQQLRPTQPAAKQLASEMLWLMLLCPSNTLAPRKREIVAEVWQWSGTALPQSTGPLLTDEVLRGIGSAGTAYNTARWRGGQRASALHPHEIGTTWRRGTGTSPLSAIANDTRRSR